MMKEEKNKVSLFLTAFLTPNFSSTVGEGSGSLRASADAYNPNPDAAVATPAPQTLKGFRMNSQEHPIFGTSLGSLSMHASG